MRKLLWRIYTIFLSFSFLPNWWIKDTDKNILDLGCGRGLPMELIRIRHSKINSTGVDVYPSYIKECKMHGFYNQCLNQDLLKFKYKKNNYDVVMALQVLEHVTKDQAWRMLSNMEKTAKRLVIISTPYGKTDYETDDGNVHQHHKSFFYPKEFEKRGYKTVRIGGKSLFGENGLAQKFSLENPIRKLVFVLDILFTPFYLLFQNSADYFFFAYKKV